jgi:hypothetical protein
MSEAMASPLTVIGDMQVALADRLHPAITRWNRLEGRPRTHDFDRALAAEVRDGLWMLARQWQLGEFAGDDAGSPVLARAVIDVARIDAYQPDDATAGPLPDEPFEATVERRPIPLAAEAQALALDLRLVVGRRWLKLLEAAAAAGDLSADYRDAYRNRHGVMVPDPTLAAHVAVVSNPETWQQFGAAAERALDGIAFLDFIGDPANDPFDGIPATPADQPRLTTLADRLRDWFSSLIGQPSEDGNDAWLPRRLEYQFEASGAEAGTTISLRADEFHGGPLDWYAFDREPDVQEEGPETPVDRRVRTFVPASVVFEGMPNTRWWTFEDRRTNFGEVRPDTTDLGKLLLVEFALVYANDWFILPYTLPVGTLADVRGIAVTTVFGERFWVEPAPDQPVAGWARWSAYSPTPTGPGEPPRKRLVLLPSASKVLDGSPIEEVALVRDEMANMVWGVERRIALPTGAATPGAEAARQYRAFLQSLIGPPAAPPAEPAAPIRYQVMSTIPEHWIPFVPVHVEGSVREIELQRAALPRILDDDPMRPEKVRPRTSLLRHGLPSAYFLFEEEVPRAGAVVIQRYRRTRWWDGRVFTWLGVRKQTGRGEGSSGLRFDALVDTTR